ncbi:DUF4115 domain-containing protein [Endozoicomonas sp. Mp262]|uniref:RodZ domain-containing protein n=1 Tax=Endozoicomonas sp. Mp262 TaxID=2919499 RepID=UPI0021DB1023
MNSDRETGTGNVQLDADFSWDCLARVREEKGLSIEDVARKLKITESYVAALEKGDFKQFPAIAFARGYIKNYARLLGLDAEVLAASVVDSAPAVSRDRLGFGQKLERSTVRSSSLLRYAATIVSVLLISFLSYYWWNGSKENRLFSTWSESTVAVVQADAEEEVSADDAADESSVTHSSTETGSADTADNTAETKDQDPIEESAEASMALAENEDVTEVEEVVASSEASEHPLERAHLYIRFKEDCWMEVKDLSGNVVVAGLKKAGSELDLETPSSVKLRLGNAPGVELIKFAGETIDMSAQQLRKGKKVARLTLNAYEQS